VNVAVDFTRLQVRNGSMRITIVTPSFSRCHPSGEQVANGCKSGSDSVAATFATVAVCVNLLVRAAHCAAQVHGVPPHPGGAGQHE
jgi:hypothetical protein